TRHRARHTAPRDSSSDGHTPTTAVYALSLHDALPIYAARRAREEAELAAAQREAERLAAQEAQRQRASEERLAEEERQRAEDERSEEHTSELQSRENLVCRLLLEKKKKQHPQRQPARA